MYRRIVVGYDGHGPSKDALALASLFAQSIQASLLVVYVAIQEPPWYRTQRTYQRELRKEVQAILDPALDSLPAEIDASKASIASTSVTRGLYDLAAEEHATLLVLGSTHHGPIGRVVLGSVGELLMMGAPCAVTVAPKGFSEREDVRLDVIGAGFDGSPESRLAVESAHALAQAVGGRLRALGVNESRLRRGGKRGGLESALDDALGELPKSIDTERAVLDGTASGSLAEAAKETDVLVVGSRGYGPMHHVLLGSVSAKLMRTAPCPLLVVPRGAPAPTEDLTGAVAGREAPSA
jgi:nucleotide-binding universal stress UspA family protein